MASAAFLKSLRDAAEGRTIASIASREIPADMFPDDEEQGVRIWFEHEEGKPDWVELHATPHMFPDSISRPILTLTWPTITPARVQEVE